ncbi:MAG: hypothetical protein IJ777_02875 [Clostridia bacterium]|nr:hypothetical protein [Clostridia bacterium]
MENEKLKNQIRKSVKEKIAVSNMREKIDMEKRNSKKVIYSVLSTCAILMLCVGIIVETGKNKKEENQSDLNHQYASVEDISREKKEIEININQLGSMGATKLDIDVKTVENYYMIPYFEVLSNLKIPSDFDNTKYYKRFGRSDRSKDEYDKFIDYEFIYSNTSNGRNIVIAFSDTNEPLRDYFFKDEGKVSTINGIELTIYQYKDMYMTKFSYSGYHFDIETKEIQEAELVDLLQSIIKDFIK